ncbi:DUF6221 family protein [Streptomyces sp. NPDC001142]
MADLVTFLRDRLDEDARNAEARRGIFPSPAVNDDGSVCLHVRPGGNMAITWYRNPAEGWDDMAKLRNWANTEHGWTQERVLREVDAKRQIVDAYLPPGIDPHPGQPCINYEGQDPAEHTRRNACSRHLAASERLLHNDYALRLLALPYADHPDYQPEWRP